MKQSTKSARHSGPCRPLHRSATIGGRFRRISSGARVRPARRNKRFIETTRRSGIVFFFFLLDGRPLNKRSVGHGEHLHFNSPNGSALFNDTGRWPTVSRSSVTTKEWQQCWTTFRARSSRTMSCPTGSPSSSSAYRCSFCRCPSAALRFVIARFPFVNVVVVVVAAYFCSFLDLLTLLQSVVGCCRHSYFVLLDAFRRLQAIGLTLHSSSY